MTSLVDGGRLAGGIAMGALVGLFGALLYFGASKRRRFSDAFLALFAAFAGLVSDIALNSLELLKIPTVRGRAIAAAAITFAFVAMIGVGISKLKQSREADRDKPHSP